MGRVPRHPQIEEHVALPPEWRMNPVTGQWVIVAPERASRPMMIRFEESLLTPRLPESCPFCEGQEVQTPGELAAFRSDGSQPNAPGWSVRVVPNAYAAVKDVTNARISGGDFFQSHAAIGRHELFLECPHHEKNLARLPVEQVRQVVRMWRERMEAAGREPSLKYAQLFKNHGPEAGASVEHAHSQMIATPLVPKTIREEMAFAAEFHSKNGNCVYCELLRREREAGVRTVAETSDFAAVSAFAARQPFETWIVPKTHRSRFEHMTIAEADDLGTILWEILHKMNRALGDPAYNLVFHSGPFHEEPLPFYHWHLEVLPRMTQLAGYEWGSGSHVTPILPEDAALILRETAL